MLAPPSVRLGGSRGILRSPAQVFDAQSGTQGVDQSSKPKVTFFAGKEEVRFFSQLEAAKEEVSLFKNMEQKIKGILNFYKYEAKSLEDMEEAVKRYDEIITSIPQSDCSEDEKNELLVFGYVLIGNAFHRIGHYKYHLLGLKGERVEYRLFLEYHERAIKLDEQISLKYNDAKSRLEYVNNSYPHKMKKEARALEKARKETQIPKNDD
jgi:hypothetical protein